MKPDRHELWTILDGLQMDARALNAKIVQLRAIAAQLDLPKPSSATCPICGVKTKGPRTLAEHIHVSHDGPIPDHWLETDRIAEEPVIGRTTCPECGDDVTGTFLRKRQAGPQPPPPIVVICRNGHPARYQFAEPAEAT